MWLCDEHGMAGDVIDMRIYVVARGYFEGMRGRSEEREALGAFRVISINATGEEPPFGVEFLGLPTLLVLRFDDVSESYEDGVFMTSQDAKRVIDFVAEESPEKPLVIHCTAGVSRSGAVGEVLNDWLNRIVSPNEADYERFRREHPHLVPNTHVRRLLLAEIERRMAL